MSNKLSPAVEKIMEVYEAVPHLKRLRETVLLADVWQQAELGQRERSMITCAMLAVLGRDDELASHVEKALGNGVTPDELRGMAVHVAFYGGWPAGLAMGKAALPHLSERS
jgi:4-carboxymuconolactone decarboxylase